jgi:hypothetical protein
MSRKTVNVEFVIEKANAMLTIPNERFSSDAAAIEFRWGVIGMVEGVLFETDTYSGFAYQRSEFDELKEGQITQSLKADFDNSRRVYYWGIKK